jgi:lysyl endopeptidase
MVVYWNYQQPYCRPPDTPPSGDEDEGTLDAFSSGAVLRARNGFGRRSIAGRPDVSLVELDDSLDPSLNLYFAGWNRALSPPERSTTIHHPQTLEKRISFDYDPARVTAYQPEATSADTTHLRVVDWDRGTTEAGSSGAPLFDDRERVVGVLSGGFAACGNDQSDWYGRFAVGWDAGDRPDARLRDWLAPDGQNPKTLGGMPLRAGTQLAFFDASVSGRAVQLSWQVARADGDADQFLLEQAPAGDGASFQPVTTRPASPDRSRIYSYRVADLPVGTYRFRLQQVGPDGSRTMLDSIRAQVTLQEPVFLRAAPNPVRTSATVRFAVQATQPVQVGLFDALGRRVRTVFDEQLTAQTEARRTLSVEGLASGVYFLRLRTPDQQAVRRITVVR